MIKAIVFDFDGVILESTLIKTQAFRDMFSSYPEKVDEIVDHHVENGGISRYHKFEYIYRQILKEPLTAEKSQELGQLFTDLALDNVLLCPYVAGAKEFLETHRKQYKFFIASGTPDMELQEIIKRRNMEPLFDGVFGSEQTKAEIVQEIMEKYGFERDELIFVGDANSDRLAAKQTQIPFVFRVHKGDAYEPCNEWHCYDLKNLNELIKEIEQVTMRGV